MSSSIKDKSSAFRHVNYGWDDDYAARLDPVARLVYRSNLLGADGRITNTGGRQHIVQGDRDRPADGRRVEVLWVKGSGGDLRTSKRENFSSLYMDKLLGLQQHYHHAPHRGPKTPIEDAIVGLYSHCTFNLNPAPLVHRYPAACLRAIQARGPHAPQRCYRHGGGSPL